MREGKAGKEGEREGGRERENERGERKVVMLISFILPHKLLMVPACIHIDQ